MTALATWFTPSLRVLSRSDGRSAVAAAAYRACAKLHDALYGKIHDYTRKGGHVISKIFGDHEMGLEQLWNAAEAADTRKNSRTAREIMVPLPSEWTSKQREKFCDDLGTMLEKEYGVAGTYSIHRPTEGKNFHVHTLFTTRAVRAGEFKEKTRILDEGKKNGEIGNLRNRIAALMNLHAQRNGNDFFVTGGKFAEYDADHIPTLNIPINASPSARQRLTSENAEILEARGRLQEIERERVRIEQASAAIELERQNTIMEFTKGQTASIDAAVAKSEFTLEALRIKNGYELLVKSRRQAKSIKSKIEDTRTKIGELSAISPSVFESAYDKLGRLIRGTGIVSIAPSVIESRRAQLEQLNKNLGAYKSRYAKLANIVARPENIEMYRAWLADDRYRNAIEKAQAEMPDNQKHMTGNHINRPSIAPAKPELSNNSYSPDDFRPF